MLEYYSGNDEANSNGGSSSSSSSSKDSGSSWRSGPPDALLSPEDFQTTKKLAVKHVRVPQNVIQLLADLRIYLQVGVLRSRTWCCAAQAALCVLLTVRSAGMAWAGTGSAAIHGVASCVQGAQVACGCSSLCW